MKKIVLLPVLIVMIAGGEEKSKEKLSGSGHFF
jgi:hypothetical protein